MGSLGRRSDHAETLGGTKSSNEEGNTHMEVPRSGVPEASEHANEVAPDIEVARDISTGQAELSRSPQQTPQRIR